jgi:very-short-patch-repair endonuclease
MMFKSIKGREFTIDLRPSKWPRRTEAQCKSNIQWRVGQLIDKRFPGQPVLEEFYIPGEKLRIDFFLPRSKLAVEVMGEQHYTYSKFFHGNKENFIASKSRDSRKALWCEINDIKLVKIDEKMTEEEIEKVLSSL